jgi:transcriptional regulator with XRE-family HTH domain
MTFGSQNSPRKFLAREIKRAREAKGATRETLAKVLFVSESLVRGWERATRLIQPDHLRKVEDFVGPESTKGILSRLREELITNDPAPEWAGKWLDIERDCNSVWWFHPLLVPGIFQTADYARAVISTSGRPVDNLEEQVQARLARQHVLGPDDGAMVVAIIDEGVLYRPLGGAKVLHEQLMRLLELIEQPNIIVQVVPIEVGGYPGLSGIFGIAATDRHEYAYVEDAFRGEVLDQPDDVALIKRIWVTLHNEALPGKQSIELIAKAVERWKA